MAALATAEELATFTGRTMPAAQADLVLTMASEVVRGHCGWHIAPQQSETVTLDGVPERVLLLPTTHVTDVAQVSVDGYVLEATGYQWSADGKLWRSAGWGQGGYRSVEVILTHGYAATPDVVKAATLAAAARYLSNPEGLKQLTVGSISRTYATGSTADTGVMLSGLEERVLAPYRVQDRA